MLRMVLVVSCIKRFELIRIISDKYRNVATMFHQIFLMLRLKVTPPLQRGRVKVIGGTKQQTWCRNTVENIQQLTWVGKVNVCELRFRMSMASVYDILQQEWNEDCWY